MVYSHPVSVPASLGSYTAYKLIKTPCGQCPALEKEPVKVDVNERESGEKSCKKAEGAKGN